MMKKIISVLLITVLILVSTLPIYANSIVSITDVKISTDAASQKVTVQGKISSGENKKVTIMVTNPDGEIDYLDQTVSGEEGTFSFTFRPNKWIDGNFGIELGGEEINNLYTEELQLETSPQNNPPVFESIENKIVQKGEELTFTVKASDADGDKLTYSASGLPEGAAFDADTGVFSWTPAKAGIFEVTFTVSDGKGGSDSQIVKITVKDSTIITATIENVKITVDKAARKVTIQGVISSGAGKEVTIAVKNPSGSYDYIDQTTSGDGGAFTFVYTLSELVYGKYSVRIGGEGVETPHVDSFTIKKASTGGGSYTPPGNDSTETEAKHDEDLKYTANFGEEALKKAIEEAEDGIARLKVTGTEEAGELLINIPAEDLELAVKKGIARIEIETDQAIISINPEILKNSKGEYPSNIELTIKKVDTSALPEKAESMIGNNTVYDFGLSVDNKAIDSFETGDVAVSIEYTLKPGENPNKVVVYHVDDSGNVKAVVNGRYNPKTGKVEFALKEMGMYTAVYNDVTFSDTSSVQWANEAIEYLAARGVISGPGDGTFRPNDKVTRAEFIKMLIMALELVDEEAVCTFSDVKEGAWYYKSIAAAEKLGIVNGKGDGTFGVNDEILRQDMAAMIYRAAQLLGVDMGDDAIVAPFTDEAEISGYAKEAVAAMQKAGIINGIGDGSFAPKNNATRAEAAVIIYRLLSKIQ